MMLSDKAFEPSVAGAAFRALLPTALASRSGVGPAAEPAGVLKECDPERVVRIRTARAVRELRGGPFRGDEFVRTLSPWVLSGAILAAWSWDASAHHAFGGYFDMGTVTEIEGEVTQMSWRNPHVRFSVRTDAGDEWQIETNSVSILRRMELDADLIKVGDRLRIAGGAAKDGSHAMFSNNVLLADGREVVLRPGVAPHWTDEALGSSEVWLANGTAAQRSLFRVWSTHFTGPSRNLWLEDYPLTEAARIARDRFDPVTEVLIADCAPKGMPWIMAQPYPIEFLEGDGQIELRLEEYDTVRTIHMADASVFSAAPSPLGNSVGRWAGDELHVTTRGIDWPYLNQTGIPQSPDVEMAEVFRVSDDGSRLEYELTITDAATFTEPVHLDKQWMWRPGEQVRPYECTPLGP